MSRRFARYVAAAVMVLMCAVGCGSGSSSPSGATAPTLPPAPPQLKQFLRLPVADPASCPPGTVSSTVGRVSPWTGHVDITAFLKLSLRGSATHALGTALRAKPLVSTVYFESQRQAHEEFARLYTCSDSVPTSQTPASYRIVLKPGTTTAERNGLVAQLVHQSGVDTVECDPSNPCVDVVRSAQASP